METIREQVKTMLLAKGYEKVMIRPSGQIRLFKNGEWTDDAQMMETGYGQYD